MCWHHPMMVALNRERFISRQRSLRVSLEKHLNLSLYLPSFKHIWWFSPFLLQQDQTCFYTFSNTITPWWSQPVYPLQPPLASRHTRCHLLAQPTFPRTDTLLSLPCFPSAYFISPLAALNPPHPLPGCFNFPLFWFLADQLPGHHAPKMPLVASASVLIFPELCLGSGIIFHSHLVSGWWTVIHIHTVITVLS